MESHTKFTMNIRDVEARQVLREIELTLRGYTDNKANNPLISDSLSSILNGIYKDITGVDCPDCTQTHLHLDENISTDVSIKTKDVGGFLNWIRGILYEFQPYFGNGTPKNFNVILGKPLNDVYRSIVGVDLPVFTRHFSSNSKLLGNQIVREIMSGRLDEETLKIAQKELYALIDYNKELSIRK